MNGFYTNILGSLTARMAKTPVVITGVRTEVAGQNGYHQILERTTAHWIDLYMSVSDESRMQMLRKPWVKDGKVVVVHNGVDPLWARGVLNDEDHKRQTTSNSNPHGIRINSHAPQIGMISAFNRLKAHDILVQAAPAILTKSPKAKFVLMGEGKTKSRITKLIEQKKLSESFILEDFTIDPRCILSQLDIFVLATHTEGLPVSILEAMAFGLPVVASKVGGIPEIVQDGITGILVPPDDPEALASAIIKLLEHPAKAKRMGMLGKLRVKREFGIDKMMEKWVDHYEYLAKRKGII